MLCILCVCVFVPVCFCSEIFSCHAHTKSQTRACAVLFLFPLLILCIRQSAFFPNPGYLSPSPAPPPFEATCHDISPCSLQVKGRRITPLLLMPFVLASFILPTMSAFWRVSVFFLYSPVSFLSGGHTRNDPGGYSLHTGP